METNPTRNNEVVGSVPGLAQKTKKKERKEKEKRNKVTKIKVKWVENGILWGLDGCGSISMAITGERMVSFICLSVYLYIFISICVPTIYLSVIYDLSISFFLSYMSIYS